MGKWADHTAVQIERIRRGIEFRRGCSGYDGEPAEMKARGRRAIKRWREMGRLAALLGAVCRCCGAFATQIDHVMPVRKRNRGMTRELALEAPGLFQMLCASCNRWKSDGPFCPCKWWKASGWKP